MNIRPIEIEKDLPTLRGWWEGHGVIPVPEDFLPEDGFMATEGGAEVAACFLYLFKGGKLAMVEYLTTNPAFSFTKTSLAAFHALLEHTEKVSEEHGCTAIISMIKPGSSEERIMGRAGYKTSQDCGHRMFGKKLQTQEATCP